jgi:putative oxidoreductase
MDLAIFALRIVVGLLFAGHGLQKLFGLFGGGGLEGTASTFESVGLRPGRAHAVLAGCAETGAGALLALGLLMPLAAAAMIAVMTAAVIAVHARNGLWSSDNGFEYNLVLVTIGFALACVGSGSWSLDAAFGIELAGVGWALAALGGGLLGGVTTVIGGRLYANREGGSNRHAHLA